MTTSPSLGIRALERYCEDSIEAEVQTAPQAITEDAVFG